MILHGNLYLVISLFWYSGCTSHHFKKDQITKEDMRNKRSYSGRKQDFENSCTLQISDSLCIWLSLTDIKLWSHKFPFKMAFSENTKQENLVRLTSATLLLILILIFLWFTVLNWIRGEVSLHLNFKGDVFITLMWICRILVAQAQGCVYMFILIIKITLCYRSHDSFYFTFFFFSDLLGIICFLRFDIHFMS